MDISLAEGRLTIPDLTYSQIRQLYNKLRVDLLNGDIPHYRPVAFKLEAAKTNTVESNISKIPGFGYSFSELSFILNNIIISERRGVMPTPLEASASFSKLKSDCSFITLMGDTIGTEVPESMFYSGEGIQSTPRMLLNDITIFRKLKTSIGITVILMKGSGKKDFSDNQRLVYNTVYKPMRTTYNLYNYFSIKEYTGDDFIQLNYLEDINEDVLKSILSDYFEQEEVLVCLK